MQIDDPLLESLVVWNNCLVPGGSCQYVESVQLIQSHAQMQKNAMDDCQQKNLSSPEQSSENTPHMLRYVDPEVLLDDIQ